jgi:hypothetical protein
MRYRIVLVLTLALSTVTAAPLQFQPAPLLDVTPRIGGFRVEIPLEVDRRCTAPERRLCVDICSDSGQGVTGCSVSTIDGKLTQVCACGDPGLRT